MKLALSLLALATTIQAPAATAADRIYTVGIVPQFDTRKIHAIWRPIIEALEQRTGLTFKLLGKPTIPDFERALANDEFDFAYINPYSAVAPSTGPHCVPLAREHGTQLYGILVVHKDNPLQNPQDLETQTIAFPAPNALGATLMIKADLEDLHQTHVDAEYVLTHSSVYFNVALGRAIAGGGVQKTLQEQPPAIRDKLRVLYRTRSVAPHPFCAHSRVPKSVRRHVQDQLLALGSTPAGQQLLTKVPIQRIGPATMTDYQPLLEMNLQRYYTESH